MKILMVAPRFSPRSGGGGFVVTNNLCKELVKRGHNVAVWTSDYESDLPFWQKEYVGNPQILPFATEFTLAGFHVTLELIKFAEMSFRLAKDAFSLKLPWGFNAIHLQGCRTFQNIVVYHYARKYKIPYIVEAHGFPIQGTWLYKLVLKAFDIMFANKIVRNASMCIAETETGKKEYLRAGVKEDRIRIIPCPYDLSIFDNLPERGKWRNRHNVPSGAKIIGFLGGLDKIKGLDFLTKTFANVCQEKDDILVLAGTDMGFKKELEVLIKDLRIGGHVIFTGYISGRDKLEFLVDCDVCVFPSRAEQGLPFAALESMMCGTPIIVTSGTGAAEDVSRMGCGQVVKFGDEEELGLAIKLASNDKIGVKNGQKYIRANLSMDVNVKKYEEVYRQAI